MLYKMIHVTKIKGTLFKKNVWNFAQDYMGGTDETNYLNIIHKNKKAIFSNVFSNHGDTLKGLEEFPLILRRSQKKISKTVKETIKWSEKKWIHPT